jgi:hypothetical protein
LIDAKVAARRVNNTEKMNQLQKQIRKLLNKDRKSRITNLALEIDDLPSKNSTQQAYGKLRNWYREKPGHTPKPTIQDEKKT